MDEELTAIGFMFDAMREKLTKEVRITTEDREIALSFSLIGEDPGHVQSGHYLWPAAHFLATFLGQNWSNLKRSYVIELGAGIGMCGILVSHLGDQTQSVVLTDYDPGCLELLQINIQQNSSELNCRTQYLEWGGNIQELLPSSPKDLLIIGSDLLYCKGVVQPLFQSVSQLLKTISSSNSLFLLASSFDVGEDVNAEVSRCCDEFGLVISELFPLVLPDRYRLQSFSLQSSNQS